MNTIIYTQDLEPVTVLDLPLWLLEEMERRGTVKIAVQEPPVPDPEQIDTVERKTVTLHCYRVQWRDGTTKAVVVTPDEELALLLKPEWLPGQRATVNQYRTTIAGLTEQLYRAMRKN